MSLKKSLFTTSNVELQPTHSFKNVTSQGEVLTTIVSPVTHKIVEITGDVDEAMKLALESDDMDSNEGPVKLDPETDRKLLMKIDFYMMPVMCLLYCCQFMDKISNSYASILGLRKDLGMVGDMYSWTGTSFYLGYLFFEFPASYMLQKLPVAKTVGVFIVLWGMILCLHSVPQYAGFITLRTILGMLESAVTPSFVIITGQWYRRDEQFVRTAWWFAFNGLGTIFGGAIAYGVSVHKDSYSMDAWKLIFIITGCITIFMGFIILLHIPDSPMNAWFLTKHEKRLVVERIRINQQGFGNKHFKWSQFVEAITDVQTWLLFIFALSSDIPNGGVTNFSSILLTESFGYDATTSLLMNMPFGAVELVGCIAFANCYRFFPQRLFWAILTTTIVVIAACLLAFAKNAKARLAGYYLFGLGPLGFICLLSCVASNFAGHTKKVTVNAIFLIGYCTGNIIGPQTFIANQAPDYNGAKVAIVVCYIVSLVTLCLIYYIYRLRNKKRDALANSTSSDEKDSENQHELQEFEKIKNLEFADLTDKQNPNFRYSI